jgi:hypothetical protein
MADDLPFPDSVKDFVFDLHDASRRSFISSEQLGLYQTIFREITAKVRINNKKIGVSLSGGAAMMCDPSALQFYISMMMPPRLLCMICAMIVRIANYFTSSFLNITSRH